MTTCWASSAESIIDFLGRAVGGFCVGASSLAAVPFGVAEVAGAGGVAYGGCAGVLSFRSLAGNVSAGGTGISSCVGAVLAVVFGELWLAAGRAARICGPSMARESSRSAVGGDCG